jgi:hypothetical protein
MVFPNFKKIKKTDIRWVAEHAGRAEKSGLLGIDFGEDDATVDSDYLPVEPGPHHSQLRERISPMGCTGAKGASVVRTVAS